jgi:Zn-dependent peptidase ImmA (M78 family)
MLAQCDPEHNMIFVRKKEKPDPDYMFAIAHEIRHIWQHKKDAALYFSNYKTSETCENIDEYNLQLAELDANAFAGIIMTDVFGLKPKFNGLSDIAKNKTFEHMEHLLVTEFAR